MSHFFPSSSFTATGSHLRINGLSFSYPDRRVLTDVSFVVSAGERLGLIGENGSGKSTLLRVIAGGLEPSAGEITMNSRGRGSPAIGLLRQDAPFTTDASINESLNAATIRSRNAAEAVSTIAEALTLRPEDQAMTDAYTEALESAERFGAWEIDARVSMMLTGLGLGNLDRNRSTASLSGGQRARLGLACLLLSAPDVLLLDEPTNHLDAAGSSYLTKVLKAWPGPVLIASHDRAFLDDTVTSVVDLDPIPLQHSLTGALLQDGPGTGVGLTRFSGNYSDYLAARTETKKRWDSQYREEQNELSRLRAAVRDQQTVGHTNWRARSEVRGAQKFYADRNAQVVSRRVNDARARLAKLEDRQVRKPPQELKFRGFTAPGTPTAGTATAGTTTSGTPTRGTPTAGTTETVILAEDVTVAGRLAATSLSVNRGEKWLISGPNGSGKSTLLHLFAQTLSPSSGRIHRVSTERIGLLAQETTLPDPLDRGPTRTALEAYVDLIGAERAKQVPLSTLGLITGRDHNTPVARLSIGQQRRLALAAVIADPPGILLLDEPTNHFSLDLVTSLERAIRDYPGTVVIASHDRWLRETWSGQRLELFS